MKYKKCKFKIKRFKTIFLTKLKKKTKEKKPTFKQVFSAYMCVYTRMKS